jgi:uncharacterized protein (TIGR02466 family)
VDPTLAVAWQVLGEAELHRWYPSRALPALARAAHLDPRLAAHMEEAAAQIKRIADPSEWADVEARTARVQALLASDPRLRGEVHVPPAPRFEVPSTPLPGRAMNLFATPVDLVNLFDAGLELSADALNAPLVALATHAFSRFRDHVGEAVRSPAEANNMFFQWQMQFLDPPRSSSSEGLSRVDALKIGTGWQELAHLPEFGRLRAHVLAACRTAAMRHGYSLPPEPQLYSWTSVHAGGSEHPPHIHEDSMLSAVYYAHVPPGAGPLVFEDPRGAPVFASLRTAFGNNTPLPLAPFHQTFRLHPHTGDLVLFPSWLRHSVERSVLSDNENRISFSFNILGYFQDSVGVGE